MIEIFIVTEDGGLLRLPRSLLEELRNRTARLPQYAGRRLRCVEVIKVLDERGVPQSVTRIVPYYLAVDPDGYGDLGEMEEAAADIWRHAIEDTNGDTEIVDFQQRKEKRDREQRYRWGLSQNEISQVTSAALGHPRGVKNVKSVKTPSPKKVKSWAAEHAVGKMSEPLWKLQTAIENLEEKDLAVLAELLVEKAELDGYMAPVWNGMREISLRSQEVQRLRRTGEGAWWAPVDMMKWTGPNISESAHHWEEKRDTREAAAATAREIAQANSHLIESDMTVEIRVCTDLEYQHGLD